MPSLARDACRMLGVLVITTVMSLVAACSRNEPVEAPPEAHDAAAANPEVAMAAVRAAVGDQNLGDAAAKAKAAQSRFPADPRIHLLAAEVEARLGNAGNAAAAFRRATASGLKDPVQALRDPAFDTIRTSEPFQRLRAELVPARVTTVPQARPFAAESVRAGDVEISSDATGDYVRAGDIVIDTRP